MRLLEICALGVLSLQLTGCAATTTTYVVGGQTIVLNQPQLQCNTNIYRCAKYECFGGDGTTIARLTPEDHVVFCYENSECVNQVARSKYGVPFISCTPPEPPKAPPPISELPPLRSPEDESSTGGGQVASPSDSPDE